MSKLTITDSIVLTNAVQFIFFGMTMESLNYSVLFALFLKLLMTKNLMNALIVTSGKDALVLMIKFMPKPLELTGQRFGKLKVIRRVTNSAKGSARWLCLCKCGKYSLVTSANLRNGNSKTCGCGQVNKKYADLTGLRFGRLVVKKLAFRRKKVIYWECVCDCGDEKTIVGKSLKNGNAKSCGCLQREINSAVHKIVAARTPRTVKGTFAKIS